MSTHTTPSRMRSVTRLAVAVGVAWAVLLLLLLGAVYPMLPITVLLGGTAGAQLAARLVPLLRRLQMSVRAQGRHP